MNDSPVPERLTLTKRAYRPPSGPTENSLVVEVSVSPGGKQDTPFVKGEGLESSFLIVFLRAMSAWGT